MPIRNYNNYTGLNGLAMLNINKYIEITLEEILEILNSTKHNRKLLGI